MSGGIYYYLSPVATSLTLGAERGGRNGKRVCVCVIGVALSSSSSSSGGSVGGDGCVIRRGGRGLVRGEGCVVGR